MSSPSFRGRFIAVSSARDHLHLGDGSRVRGTMKAVIAQLPGLIHHLSPQLATTFTWAVDPQVVETNTWRPELVSRTV